MPNARNPGSTEERSATPTSRAVSPTATSQARRKLLPEAAMAWICLRCHPHPILAASGPRHQTRKASARPASDRRAAWEVPCSVRTCPPARNRHSVGPPSRRDAGPTVRFLEKARNSAVDAGNAQAQCLRMTTDESRTSVYGAASEKEISRRSEPSHALLRRGTTPS
jgi:hypothetical protein